MFFKCSVHTVLKYYLPEKLKRSERYILVNFIKWWLSDLEKFKDKLLEDPTIAYSIGTLILSLFNESGFGIFKGVLLTVTLTLQDLRLYSGSQYGRALVYNIVRCSIYVLWELLWKSRCTTQYLNLLWKNYNEQYRIISDVVVSLGFLLKLWWYYISFTLVIN